MKLQKSTLSFFVLALALICTWGCSREKKPTDDSFPLKTAIDVEPTDTNWRKVSRLTGVEPLWLENRDRLVVVRLTYSNALCDTIQYVSVSAGGNEPAKIQLVAFFIGERADGSYHGPDTLLVKNETTIDANDLDSLFQKIEGMLFWEIGKNENFAFDGYEYALECYCGTDARCPGVMDKKQRYHNVTRKNPTEGSFKNTCEFLLQKAEGSFGRISCRPL